jgi:hypothetical protein
MSLDCVCDYRCIEIQEKMQRYYILKKNAQKYIDDYNNQFPDQKISFKWSDRNLTKKHYNPTDFSLNHSDELTIEDLCPLFLNSYFKELRDLFFEYGAMECVSYSTDDNTTKIIKYSVSSF